MVCFSWLSIEKKMWVPEIYRDSAFSCRWTAAARCSITRRNRTARSSCTKSTTWARATATTAAGGPSSTVNSVRPRPTIRWSRFERKKTTRERKCVVLNFGSLDKKQNIASSSLTTLYKVTPNRGFPELHNIRSTGVIGLDPFGLFHSVMKSTTQWVGQVGCSPLSFRFAFLTNDIIELQ